MNPKYDAKSVEAKWQQLFDQKGFFSPDESKKEPFTIVMPPPNVTGVLHNGHALFVTLQDVLIRYKRLKGFKALWLPGTDHAGIATQTVVERELKKSQNKNRYDLGREQFTQEIWNWVKKNGQVISNQMKRLGASADWSRHKFTLDPECVEAVNHAFVKLWNDGLIYRGERLVNWDPGSQTALSNEEVDYVSQTGELTHFAYKLKKGEGEIVVATTRPETMLGDTAIAVHPDDERYKTLVGQLVEHPFFKDRSVKIIADAMVDQNFGTGAVKITPAHDPADFETGERHGLERISVIGFDAKINQNGGPYQGLSVQEARLKIKQDLEALGLMRGTEKITHNISISSRSGEVIEPLLSKQYFLKMKEMAGEAIKAVDSGETRLIPASWKKTYDHFLTNIQDWCISRQLWWGHQIPVYYDVQKLAGRNLQDLSEQEVRELSIASTEDLVAKHGAEQYRREEDVLDTWFSSALWPMTTLGWPKETHDLKTFYPTSVLETGFDILFFWVARMMMFGTYFMGQAPFKDVYLHAMVRDSHGKKMSKSLGNAIDPIDVVEGISLEELLAKTKTYPVPEKLLPQVLKGIEKDYPEGIPASGADGLRLSLAMLSGQGRDVKLSIPRVSGYRAFLNKIWNATRFVLSHVEVGSMDASLRWHDKLALEDRAILSRLQQVIAQTETYLDQYHFSAASDLIYQFFWTEVCDWYLELSKLRIKEPGVQNVLVELLSVSVRLLHPFCPFVTEEIWEHLPNTTGYCSFSEFPKANPNWIDEKAEQEFEQLKEVVTMIRNARQESNLPTQKRLTAIVLANSPADLEFISSFESALKRLALLDSVDFKTRKGAEIPQFSAINSSARFDVILPLEGLLDLDNEKKRLSKELDKVVKERDSLEKRLSNRGFIEKAPPEVLSNQKDQLKLLQQKLSRIKNSLDRLTV